MLEHSLTVSKVRGARYWQNVLTSEVDVILSLSHSEFANAFRRTIIIWHVQALWVRDGVYCLFSNEIFMYINKSKRNFCSRMKTMWEKCALRNVHSYCEQNHAKSSWTLTCRRLMTHRKNCASEKKSWNEMSKIIVYIIPTFSIGLYANTIVNRQWWCDFFFITQLWIIFYSCVYCTRIVW